ncbi:Glycosyl transferase [Rhodococcus sp. AW25M09]|uniref:glycosyltransferase family 2 protein n=1 Tax=Rhodococcus sp. AW25M09 TaxID=1268303 RepID=UPI0002ABF3C7|nr:glycosyltransferase [Rhodococcus sp. AW25M09]CCQ13633.1 Glycosyl transferase [Rhodococcus sp. AW25M09]
MPRVSVLLPARNAGSTLVTAIRSTLLAMPRDSELVVFDDGSTDSTADVLESFYDRRLRTISGSNTGGSGVANALNTLIENTDSEIIARMDADDITLPHRFWLQERQMDSSGAKVEFGNVIHFGVGFSIPRPSRPVGISIRAMPLALLISNPVAHSTMFARRDELVKAGGYRPGPAEDYDLWLRLATARVPIHRGATPILAYRHHASQVTANTAWLAKARMDPAVKLAYRNCLKAVLGVDSQEKANEPLDQTNYIVGLKAEISALPDGADRSYLSRFMAEKFGNGSR